MNEAGMGKRLPLRTRLGLRLASLRRRTVSRELHPIAYGAGTVYLSDIDFAVDRASFVFAVVEATYATDYRDTVVLDIGAHKGYYAAYAITHGARAVVTYEPESANLEVLERTAAGYGRRGADWTIRPAAVDAESGGADLHVMRGSWGHALAPPDSFAVHEIRVEPVAVVALESAITEAVKIGAGRRLVIKINIEGAECSAVLGTPSDAWQEVSEVFVETHPWGTCNTDDLAAHLLPAGLSRVESAHAAVLRMRREEPVRSGRRTAPR